MDYKLIGLPDNPLYRETFDVGFACFVMRAGGDIQLARQKYLKGPVAMSRLVNDICDDFDGKDIVIAACLSGPEIFARPSNEWADGRLVIFSQKIRSIAFVPQNMIYRSIETLSNDGKLFFQITAILMMEQMTHETSVGSYTADEQNRIYKDAVEIYSAARGEVDLYSLDTRFEIAAMNMTMMMANKSFLWTRAEQQGSFSKHRV